MKTDGLDEERFKTRSLNSTLIVAKTSEEEDAISYFYLDFIALKCLLYSYHQQHPRIECTFHHAVTTHKIIISQRCACRSILLVLLSSISSAFLLLPRTRTSFLNDVHVVVVKHKFSNSHRCTCNVSTSLQNFSLHMQTFDTCCCQA